jgi:hypothetical protein
MQVACQVRLRLCMSHARAPIADRWQARYESSQSYGMQKCQKRTRNVKRDLETDSAEIELQRNKKNGRTLVFLSNVTYLRPASPGSLLLSCTSLPRLDETRTDKFSALHCTSPTQLHSERKPWRLRVWSTQHGKRYTKAYMRLNVPTPPWAGMQGRGRAQQGGRAQQAQTGGSGCVRGLEEGKHAGHPLHSATHVAHGLQLRVRDLQQRAFVLLQPER